MTQSLNTKDAIKWVVTLGLPIVLLFIPTNDIYTQPIKLFLALTLCAILLFAFDTLNQTVVSLLLPFLYVVIQIAPADVALSPWTQTVPWMMISGLILANVLSSVGLLQRVAYKCIILTGGSYMGIIFGIGITGLVLNVMTPAQALVPLATLGFGICKALGLGKSPEAAGIMLAAAMASQIPTNFLLNPNVLIIYGIGGEVAGFNTTTWTSYIFHNWPNFVYYVVLLFIIAKLFMPKMGLSQKAYFVEKYNKLGAMSKDEKKGLVVCIILFALLLTQSLHGVDAAYVFILTPLLAFIPGINIGKPDDIRTANFPFIIFVVACMSIGSVASSLGVGTIVSDLVMPLLTDKSPTLILGLVWLLVVLVNFLLTPLAIQSTFTVPLTQIALSVGINPEVMWMAILHGSDQILLPYEYPLYMLFFSFGLMQLKDFSKFFGIKMVVNLIFLVAVFIPYWNLIGFLHI